MRLYFACIVWLLLCAVSYAQSIPGFAPGQFQNRAAIDGGVGSDPAAKAGASAGVTAGGTVSTTQKGYVNTLIVNLKTEYTTNYFTSCDRIWIHAAENIQQGTIDLINLGTLTSHGTITFTANQGVAGNGTTGYYDTGFTTGTNYTQNSATLASYDRTARTSGAPNAGLLGVFNGATTILTGI